MLVTLAVQRLSPADADRAQARRLKQDGRLFGAVEPVRSRTSKGMMAGTAAARNAMPSSFMSVMLSAN